MRPIIVQSRKLKANKHFHKRGGRWHITFQINGQRSRRTTGKGTTIERAKKMTQLALTFKQVAEMVNVSEATIRRMVRLGHLRAVPFLRSKRIPKSEVDRYIESNLVKHEECRINNPTHQTGIFAFPTGKVVSAEKLLEQHRSKKRKR
jgi:excisionase family DNA binding protein